MLLCLLVPCSFQSATRGQGKGFETNRPGLCWHLCEGILLLAHVWNLYVGLRTSSLPSVSGLVKKSQKLVKKSEGHLRNQGWEALSKDVCV